MHVRRVCAFMECRRVCSRVAACVRWDNSVNGHRQYINEGVESPESERFRVLWVQRSGFMTLLLLLLLYTFVCVK